MWCLFSLVTCVPRIVDVKFFTIGFDAIYYAAFFMINGNDIMVRRTRNENLNLFALIISSYYRC
jgi:hypothetical protein